MTYFILYYSRKKLKNLEKYILACNAFDSFFMQTDFDVYCPSGFVDSFDVSENMKEGDWEKEVLQTNLANIQGARIPIHNFCYHFASSSS